MGITVHMIYGHIQQAEIFSLNQGVCLSWVPNGQSVVFWRLEGGEKGGGGGGFVA